MFVLSCLNVCIIECVYPRHVLDKCLHFLHVPSINKTLTYLLTYLLKVISKRRYVFFGEA
jgi:hypothetical protein